MMKFYIKQIFKMLSQHIIFPFIYFINRWRRVDKNLVILADAHHNYCPSHIEPIKKDLLATHFKVKEHFFDLSECGMLTGMKHMISFMKMYPAAGCVIICDNFLPVSSCNKKKATKVIQLWHGSGAFKKFGYDSEDDIPKNYRGYVYKNYNLVTVSGKKCIKNFESAMRFTFGQGKDEIVKAFGTSYTDIFFDKDYISMCKDKFRYEHPDAAGKKVVLWAPTFRGNAAKAGNTTSIPGESQVNLLAQNSDIYLIKSLHPHMSKHNRGMSTRELMVCADLLITDYSSVFFDYLILDRPIIFYAPDYDKYTKDRGYYLEYTELPGEIIIGDENLCEKVCNSLYTEDEEIKDKRKKFYDEYMEACDGHATERVIEYIKNK